MSASGKVETDPQFFPIEVSGKTLQHYVVCRFCNEVRQDHLGDEMKCPFAATNFLPNIKEGYPLYRVQAYIVYKKGP